jgi:hypothetical protein
MHGAGSAERNATTKLGSSEAQDIAQIPQQWHIRVAIERVRYPIYFELNHDSALIEASRMTAFVFSKYEIIALSRLRV